MIKSKILTIIYFLIVIMFVFNMKYDSFSTQMASIFSLDNINNIAKNLENYVCSNLGNKEYILEYNSLIAKIFDLKSIHNNENIYITSDSYVVSQYNETSTDYEYYQMVSFNDFLKDNGINLLFVNEPTKYIDDSVFNNEFGVESYINRNMDTFLSRLKKSNINYIDLREDVKAERKNIKDMFYRTDHHWTTESGLWGAQKIAEGLNNYCGYNIDLSIYDKNNFSYNYFNNCWLGEQGRKIGFTYIGLDNYVEIKPNYNTSYVFKYNDVRFTGSFNDFIDESNYSSISIYQDNSYYYSYTQIDCENNDIDYGKILFITDSFGQTTEPLLSLSIKEIRPMLLRKEKNYINLRDYILEEGFDTIVIAYAPFMLGAHDDPNSANYYMYDFE